MLFFSFNKDENWFATLKKVAILKTKLLAGNDHVIDIFTSEDMENISLCIFQYLTVNYIIKCFIELSATDKYDNLTCEIIHGKFTCDDYR